LSGRICWRFATYSAHRFGIGRKNLQFRAIKGDKLDFRDFGALLLTVAEDASKELERNTYCENKSSVAAATATSATVAEDAGAQVTLYDAGPELTHLSVSEENSGFVDCFVLHP
jgi:hypothetical protein